MPYNLRPRLVPDSSPLRRLRPRPSIRPVRYVPTLQFVATEENDPESVAYDGVMQAQDNSDLQDTASTAINSVPHNVLEESQTSSSDESEEDSEITKDPQDVDGPHDDDELMIDDGSINGNSSMQYYSSTDYDDATVDNDAATVPVPATAHGGTTEERPSISTGTMIPASITSSEPVSYLEDHDNKEVTDVTLLIEMPWTLYSSWEWWFVGWNASGLDEQQMAMLRAATRRILPDYFFGEFKIVMQTKIDSFDGRNWRYFRASLATLSCTEGEAIIREGSSGQWTLSASDARLSMWRTIVDA